MKKKFETSIRIENVRPITVEQHARLAALTARSDDDIDYSDLPPLTDVFFRRAARNPFYRPVK